MFSAFIWCSYCLCRIKILNFQKFSSRKLKNFHAQTRLLPGHGEEKLQNIGWFSDILWVNKDASFHLRLCLIHLDEKWGLNNPKTTASWFLPPQFLNGPKSLAWLGLKLHCQYGSSTASQSCNCCCSCHTNFKFYDRKATWNIDFPRMLWFIIYGSYKSFSCQLESAAPLGA